MSFLIFFFAFCLGAIIGSFLNVLIFRLGTRSIRGRSFCFSCGKTLTARELIPLLSFFVQRGRCRGCAGKISWQYPLVELATGAVFASVAWKYGLFSADASLPSYSVIQLLVICVEFAVWSLLIALSVYDLRHKIIPDVFVYSLIGLSFFRFALVGLLSTGSALNFWGGPFLALPFALIWLFSRGRAMGLGDAKLVLSFSWLVGFFGALSALVLGFWAGALLALAAFLLKALLRAAGARGGLKTTLGNLTMKTELPLAPFLVFGLFLVYVFGIDVTGLGLLLQ